MNWKEKPVYKRKKLMKLLNKNVYFRYKPVICKYPKRVYVPESNNQFDTDYSLKKYSKYNDVINFLLVEVDALNRYDWAYPVKKKQHERLLKALKRFLKSKFLSIFFFMKVGNLQ